MAVLDLGEQVDAAAARHRKIEDHGVEHLLQLLKCPLARPCFGDVDRRAAVLENRADALPHHLVIIDQEHAIHMQMVPCTAWAKGRRRESERSEEHTSELQSHVK